MAIIQDGWGGTKAFQRRGRWCKALARGCLCERRSPATQGACHVSSPAEVLHPHIHMPASCAHIVHVDQARLGSVAGVGGVDILLAALGRVVVLAKQAAHRTGCGALHQLATCGVGARGGQMCSCGNSCTSRLLPGQMDGGRVPFKERQRWKEATPGEACWRRRAAEGRGELSGQRAHRSQGSTIGG